MPAPPEGIFDLLADPAMHPVIDGSGTVRAALDGNPARLRPIPLLPWFFRLAGFPERNRGIETTLDRLAGLVTAGR